MRWTSSCPAVVVIAVAACSGATVDEDVILSGSVRLDRESAQPADRAFVRVTDANKSQRCFVTACDGTFVVRREDFPMFVMPLSSVSVERVDRPEAAVPTRIVMRRMATRIGRERSCNACHAGGVPLFDTASEVPAELRTSSTTCSEPGAAPVPIACPEDRPEPSQAPLELVRDFATYSALVHAVLERRCGTTDCHGGNDPALTWRITSDRQASFASVMAHDANVIMTKARGGASHGGGALVFHADPADQCVADWLGVPRSSDGPTSSVKVTHAEACREAALIP